MSRIHVTKPGLLTTVQDLGRTGSYRFGVTTGGAADAGALRLANLLVGNPEGAAGLEITLAGPTLQFAEESLVAICGGDFEVTIAGRPLPMWRPVWLKAGVELTVGAARSGCRSYLAVAGGFAVPRVLGGRGTYLAAGFGGFEGRALRVGDVLKVGPALAWARRLAAALAGEQPWNPVRWEVGAAARPRYSAAPAVRVVRGPQWDWFSGEARERFLGGRFTVTLRSDRMGLRLAGAMLNLEAPREMVSQGIVVGTVQVPPDGQPIVLLADGQTIGGYPKIAVVATSDLALLAQLRPGDTIGFQEVAVAEAQELLVAAGRLFATVKQGIALHVA